MLMLTFFSYLSDFLANPGHFGGSHGSVEV